MTDPLQTASPELLQKEAHVKALASIARAEQEPSPIDTVSYRSEWDEGTGRMKLVPVTQADTDDTIADKLQAEAELFNAMQRETQQQDAEDQQQSFDQLFPSEQRLAIESYYTPIIKKLTADHIATCNAVSDFESDELRYRAQIQANFAYNCKHPDVRTIQCMGDNHFQHLMQSGQLQPEGYKMVDRRSMGGLSHKLVFIPQNVPSLMHYADSDEAKAFSQVEYDRDLQRLIQKRKNAAVALTQAKQKARDALAAIPTFEDLISEVVKRAKK